MQELAILASGAMATMMAMMTWRNRQERARRHQAWREGGAALGLTPRESESGLPGWHGTVGEVELRITPPKGLGNPELLSWRVEGRVEAPAFLSAVARPDVPHWPGGPGPTTTGDPVFDHEVVVHSDAHDVLAILDKGRRARLRLVLDADTQVSKGQLIHRHVGMPTTADAFVAVVEHVAEHAAMLGAVPSVPAALVQRACHDPVGGVRMEAVRRLFQMEPEPEELVQLLDSLVQAEEGDPRLALALALLSRTHIPWLVHHLDGLEARRDVGVVALRTALRLRVRPEVALLERALERGGEALEVAVEIVGAQERVELAGVLLERTLAGPSEALLAGLGAVATVEAVAPLQALSLVPEALHRARVAAVARIQERSSGDRGGLSLADPRLSGGQLTLSRAGGELSVAEE